MPQVIAGGLTLDGAYQEVQRRVSEANGEDAQMARLRESAPEVFEWSGSNRAMRCSTE